MTILRRLMGATEARSISFQDVFGQGLDLSNLRGTKAGVSVTSDNADRMTAVWACIRVLSEDVASLPVGTFRRERGRRIPTARPSWLTRPNGETTRFELFEQTLRSMLSDGNAYWHITRDELTRPLEVWPLDPTTVEPFRRGGQLGYRAVTAEGRPVEFDYNDVLHFRAWTKPGRIKGLSPIEKAREAIGLGLVAEEYGARFFGQGSHAGGVLEADGVLTADAAKQTALSWQRAHSGPSNAHLPAVVSGGLKWKQTTIPPEHAQFLETRKMQVTEIARLYRVPPHMIADLDRATFSNIEHQSLEYVKFSLRPWLERIEQVLGVLLPAGEFAKFNVEGLLRGDIKTRYEALAVKAQHGALSPNEWRALDDEPPVPGGDVYLQPLNLGPLGTKPDQGNEE